MIIYKKGDIFKGKENVIAHGCNCVGGFGSGFAYVVAQKYPKVKEMYLKRHRVKGWTLGDIQAVKVNDGPLKMILNVATQYHYLPRNMDHVAYESLHEAFIKIRDYCHKNNLSLAIPKIGAGLAGGDWNRIEAILKDIFTTSDIFIYVL